ncbi:MAG: BrnA antitoxin family protein [Acidobacteriaceae bacterium]|jgi:uncharacterized protein (DUF4415 family)
MGKIVRRAWGESRLTEQRKRELAELAKRPDSEIDYSDIPESTEEFWKNAVRNPFYKPVKKQVTLRIDADILAWLRLEGSEGYQSRLNAALRRVMLEDLQGKRKRA